MEYDKQKWAAMQNIDIRKVNKADLVDLNDIKINDELPVPQRIADFIEQIGNPYCFRVGDVAVKVVYQKDGPTFQQNIEEVLRTI